MSTIDTESARERERDNFPLVIVVVVVAHVVAVVLTFDRGSEGSYVAPVERVLNEP